MNEYAGREIYIFNSAWYFKGTVFRKNRMRILYWPLEITIYNFYFQYSFKKIALCVNGEYVNGEKSFKI
jgi:hypothetical protein